MCVLGWGVFYVSFTLSLYLLWGCASPGVDSPQGGLKLQPPFYSAEAKEAKRKP